MRKPIKKAIIKPLTKPNGRAPAGGPDPAEARRLSPYKRTQRCGAKTVAMGPGCVKSRSDAMILQVNRQAEAMHVRLRGGD